MEQEQTTSAQSSGLIYKLNDRPPLKETLFAALCNICSLFSLPLLRLLLL